MAGAEGFEPSTKVLETHVLPLHHAPLVATDCIIRKEDRFVKRVFTLSFTKECSCRICIVISMICMEVRYICIYNICKR